MNQKDNGPRYKADDLKLRYNSIFTVPQRQLELEQR